MACFREILTIRWRFAPLSPDQTLRLLQRLQFLPGFKSNRLTGRDCYLGSSSRISSDPSLARPNVKNSKTTQFNPVSLTQRLFHRFKNRFDSHLGLRLGYPCSVNDLIDDIQLDQGTSGTILSR